MRHTLASNHAFDRSVQFCAALILLLAGGSTLAATHTVTQNGDAGTGSLRWAVQQANAGVAGELQRIDFSLAEPFRQINLTSRLLVSHPNVEINGLQTASLGSPDRIRVGNPATEGSGVFELTAAVTRFALRDLDLGPATRTTYRRGGCLDAEAVSPTFSQITLERVVFSGCTVRGGNVRVEGGAVYANGGVLIRDSLFFGNRAESLGSIDPNAGFLAFGGALAMERGLLTAIDSTFEGNIAEAPVGGGTFVAGGGALAYTAINGSGMTFQGVLLVDNRAGATACQPSSAAICEVLGFGGAVYSEAASTVFRRSVFARNGAFRGAAVYQLGLQSQGFDGRLDLDNVVFNQGTAYEGTVRVQGDSARLRQRNVSYHDISLTDGVGVPFIFDEVAFVHLNGNARVDVSHSVLFGRVNRIVGAGRNSPLCATDQSMPSVPIQGNSLVDEPINMGSGTFSCAFLGATRIALAQVGIPTTGGWDFELRGLALENGAAGAPSSLDWSRCAPQDAFGRSRPIDADGNGTASCDVGAIEGLALDPEVFKNGFE
jgi:hypothetical protein